MCACFFLVVNIDRCNLLINEQTSAVYGGKTGNASNKYICGRVFLVLCIFFPERIDRSDRLANERRRQPSIKCRDSLTRVEIPREAKA